jgi:hypothetical protein
VFHVELRKFPHQARAFNLTEDELRARILLPWVRGAQVELEDQSFTPEKARLTIYEGPALAAEDRGLGRGWSTVTRDGDDVTARLLEAVRGSVPRASDLKDKLLEAAPIALGEVVSLAAGSARPSERLAVAEQAVWELLHEGVVRIERDGTPVASEEWEALLLRWESWTDRRVTISR